MIRRQGLTIEKFEDATTQTEQMYMIRGVRSCPGSRKHYQRLGAQRGMSAKFRNGGKSLPMEIPLPVFLFRKASDNLIYEKGKGSRSPSYIPVPERFRWRYVTPRKINWIHRHERMKFIFRTWWKFKLILSYWPILAHLHIFFYNDRSSKDLCDQYQPQPWYVQFLCLVLISSCYKYVIICTNVIIINKYLITVILLSYKKKIR